MTTTIEPEETEKTEFKFEELSDRAKDNVRQKYCEHGMGPDWWEFVYEDYAERCKESGFTDPEFQHSGFCSQGDGASFACNFHFEGAKAMTFLTGEDYDTVLKAVAEARLGLGLKVNFFLSGSIVVRGSYSHKYGMSIDREGAGFYETEDDAVDKLLDCVAYGLADGPFVNILNAARDTAQDLYESLEEEYDYQTSDEQIQEMSDANDRLYDEDGNLL